VTSSWTAAHKKMAAVLATATGIVGLATGVLTLRDQLFPDSDEPAKESATSRRVGSPRRPSPSYRTISG